MSEELKYRLEQNAVAILLTWSAICFGIGTVLRRTGKSIDRATTLGERR